MADPALVDLRIIQGSDWTKSFRILAGGVLIDTTGYTAAFAIRASVEADTPELTGTTEDARIAVGFDPPKRANSTAYGLGQQVVPTTLNGYVYQATVAGTSAGSAPTYPTTIGGTVVDGSVTWTA